MPPPGYPGPYGRSLRPLSQQYEMPPPGYPGPYGRSLWPLSQQYEMPPPGYPGPYGRSSRPLSQQYKIPPPGYPGPNGRGFGSLPQYDMPPLGYPSLYARGFMSLPQQYDIGLRSLRPSESMNPYERVLRPEPLTDLRIYPSSLRPLATSNPSPYQKTPTKLPPVIIYSPLPRPPEPPPLRPITLAYPLNYFPGSMFGPIRPIQSRIYPNWRKPSPFRPTPQEGIAAHDQWYSNVSAVHSNSKLIRQDRPSPKKNISHHYFYDYNAIEAYRYATVGLSTARLIT